MSNQPYTMSLTVAQWIAIPDNPRQRDTESHLRRAIHLLHPSPTHSQVSMVFCPETNQYWKLDGHTRALLWSKQPELAPNEITATCYLASSASEAAELYTHFDNAAAAEYTSDRLSGAKRELNWHPNSPYFQKNNFTFSLAIAEGLSLGRVKEVYISGKKPETTIYQLLPKWLPELQALDSIDLQMNKFKSPILVASLLTLRRRGIERNIEFWHLYNIDKGVKLESTFDGVEALSRIVASTKALNHQRRMQLIARAVSCFENWRLGKEYKSGIGSSPKSTDLQKYMQY